MQALSLGCRCSIALSMTLCFNSAHTTMRRSFNSSMFCVAVWYACSCIRPQILWSTGLRSGEFAGQSSGPMKLGVSRRSNAMVFFARCAGALSCWTMKESLDIPQNAGNIFSINRTFLQYSLITSTPGSTKNNSVHPSFVTATETISERLKVGRVRNRRLESTYIEAIFIPIFLREHFYQPTTTETLQQY